MRAISMVCYLAAAGGAEDEMGLDEERHVDGARSFILVPKQLK
jgi:hypothetical protein